MDNKPASLFVIVGHWNPSIFTVEWVREYLFPDAKDLNVLLSVEKHYAVRIETKEIQIHINEVYFKVAVLAEQTDSLLSDCQDIVSKMCNYLSHTPVRAIGINFNVHLDISKLEKYQNIFELPDNAELKKLGYENCSTTKINRSIKLSNKDLNFGMELNGKDINFTFNHHFNASRMGELKSILDENDVLTLKNESNNFLNTLYNISL